MILYQMAKRLEERNRLQHTIEQSGGDVDALVTQKELVEEQLMSQANIWTETGQDAFMLDAVTPNTDWMQPGGGLYE
ncbi:DUF2789 family protein [Paenibacillus validus]|uniref:DUF2789 family protein n=1 Tax=Paenibacillus validus TaxID=44253 RepID=A0A7X3CUN7_9BACL|nr:MULTISPECIES: DUF2789 family protein [Paenibacillus]MED4602079.1 DUF2789 family protein [Paenibacillus validus]MED4608482.1 DUF2789 family protein [Paenibacillus validus]MUG74080.1 DUF2789 family protein [Paenibacillus validus]